MKRRAWIMLGVITLLSVVLEPQSWFYAVYGFLGCSVIIFFSKALGKAFLQRREDYYG